MLQVIVTIKEHTFKNVNKAFTLKNPISCNSFNIIYILLCILGRIYWRNRCGQQKD